MKDIIKITLVSIASVLGTFGFLNVGVDTDNALTKTLPTEAKELIKASETVTNYPYLGEISIFAGNFAPRGWAFCDGQLLAIDNHTYLFSILGTTYGGDGRTTFALPDLRGRAALHVGHSAGPGLSRRHLGQRIGDETVHIPLGHAYAKTGDTTSVKVVQSVREPLASIQPALGLRYIIALDGNFPPRN